MQRCPYGYTANEFGFCQAVATDSDGSQIGIRGKSYVLINPITDLIDDTPTIELSDSTGTWEIGDGIYQGDDWANASAKGEIVGGQKLNSESPIIEYKLYGNQDFVGVDDGVSVDVAVVRRHDSTPTVKLYGSTGTWQVGDAIYQGADYDTASVKGVITGGTGLGTSSPIIEYNPSTGDGFIEDVRLKQYDLSASADGAATGIVSYGLAMGTAEQVITTGELIADYAPCS